MNNVEEACRIARRETRRLNQPHVVYLAEVFALKQFAVLQKRLYELKRGGVPLVIAIRIEACGESLQSIHDSLIDDDKERILNAD